MERLQVALVPLPHRNSAPKTQTQVVARLRLHLSEDRVDVAGEVKPKGDGFGHGNRARAKAAGRQQRRGRLTVDGWLNDEILEPVRARQAVELLDNQPVECRVITRDNGTAR